MSELAVIELAGARLTPTGLELTDPTLDFDSYEQIGWLLGRMRDSTAWALGDWILFGEATYGEKMAQAVEATGRSKSTLQNYVWLSRQVPRSRRRSEVPWSHYRLVAKLSPAEQDEWIGRAAEEGLSYEEFSGLLRPSAPVASPEPLPLLGAPENGSGGHHGAGNGAGSFAGSLLPLDEQETLLRGAAVAGVDFSTYIVTVAVLDLDGFVADVQDVRIRRDRESGEEEAFEAMLRVPAALSEIDLSRVGVVWVERGRGKGRNADWALGRVQGAVAATLAARGFAVNELALGDWRKRLTGKGSGDRDALVAAQRRALVEAGVLIRRVSLDGLVREPVSPAFEPLTKDELDAVAVAYVGREIGRDTLAVRSSG